MAITYMCPECGREMEKGQRCAECGRKAVGRDLLREERLRSRRWGRSKMLREKED